MELKLGKEKILKELKMKEIKNYELDEVFKTFLEDHGLTQTILQFKIKEDGSVNQIEYDDYGNVVEVYVKDGVVFCGRATIKVSGWDEVCFEEDNYYTEYGERD